MVYWTHTICEGRLSERSKVRSIRCRNGVSRSSFEWANTQQISLANAGCLSEIATCSTERTCRFSPRDWIL